MEYEPDFLSRQMREDDLESNSSSDSSSTTSEDRKRRLLLPWKILCMVMVVLVCLGWVGIIALLIFKEEWQLVLVAWLLFYAAVHFCYWYCRRHSTRSLSAQIRQQLATRLRGTDFAAAAADEDAPPSYDDLVKSEVPPPSYYTVVDESPKPRRALNLPLPWFIKKKAMEQTSSSPKTSNSTVVVIEEAVEAAASTSSVSPSSGGLGPVAPSERVWKSRVSGEAISASGGEEEASAVTGSAPELPSYESLMREAQPVLTPIHQALSRLPSASRAGSGGQQPRD